MSTQRYISDELTHFVGRRFRRESDTEEKQYHLLCEILKSGLLGRDEEQAVSDEAGQRFSENQYYKSNVVCFSDIPVPDLGIHMGKFSLFGLSFRKSFLTKAGANPVYYVARNSVIHTADGRTRMQCDYFNDEHQRLREFLTAVQETADADPEHCIAGYKPDEVRELVQFLVLNFFSFVKFYDEGLAADHEENFYMEREWRVYGRLSFDLEDVRRVIFPERFARRFREHLPEYYGEITFS